MASDVTPIWQRHAGETVVILGAGPSLLRTDLPSGLIVGAHSAAWSPHASHLDYWVCVDKMPARSAARRVRGPPKCHHFLRSEVVRHCKPELHSPNGYTEWRVVSGERGITPDMVSSEWLEKPDRPPFALACSNSSVLPMLHLALLFGAGRIVLIGVDCGGSAPSWEQPGGWDHENPEHQKKLHRLREHKAWLESFGATWRGRVELANLSPDVRLHGWSSKSGPPARR